MFDEPTTGGLPPRFWAKVEKTDTCWLWIGGKNHYGYGSYRHTPDFAAQAHRVAYEAMVGPIPEGLTIDHLCRVPACVNPAHMEPVTRGENVLRGIGASAQNARKTHCPKGHPYDGDNVAVYHIKGRGVQRQCKTCRNARSNARYWARKRGAA